MVTTKTTKAAQKITKKVGAVAQEKTDRDNVVVDEIIQKKIENGNGIVIMLSGNILVGGIMFKKDTPYKVNKQQFEQLDTEIKKFGIAMKVLS